MAKDVDSFSEYIIFYSNLSQIIHPNQMFNQVVFRDKKLVFEPIRDLKGSDQIFRLSFNFAVSMYQRILEYFRPSEVLNFKQKYLSEWRNRFLKIKRIEIKTEDGPEIL